MYIDRSLKDASITSIIKEALMTDGAHHKQWYLDQLLRKLIDEKEYDKLYGDSKDGEWEQGIAP